MRVKLIALQFIISSFLFTGCVTPLTPYNLSVRFGSDEPLKDRLEKSRELIEERKRQAYSFTFAEKAAIFESEREFFRLPAPYSALISRSLGNSTKDLIRGTPSFASEVLEMLAVKYSVTKDPAVQQEALELLEMFLRLDNQFGKPGQLPDSLIISRNPLNKFKGKFHILHFLSRHSSGYYIYLADDAHGNTVSPHFFGAYLAFCKFDDPAVRQKSAEVIRRNIKYLLDENFVLKRLDGEPATYGGLSGNEYLGFAKNALVARLMFLEVARAVLEEVADSGDKLLLCRIQKDIETLSDQGAPATIERISPHILNFWFSTPSSNARLMRNLYFLNSAAGNRGRGDHYRRAFRYQWLKYREDHNPFFVFLYLSLIPEEKWEFKDREAKIAAVEYLKSAPLDRDDREVLNSFFDGDDDVDIDRFPRVYKFKLEPKNKTPLPLYRRGIRRNEWSGDPYRLNENLESKGGTLNNPLAFLVAYYFGIAGGFIPIEEQKVDKAKVDAYLKEFLSDLEKIKFQ